MLPFSKDKKIATTNELFYCFTFGGVVVVVVVVVDEVDVDVLVVVVVDVPVEVVLVEALDVDVDVDVSSDELSTVTVSGKSELAKTAWSVFGTLVVVSAIGVTVSSRTAVVDIPEFYFVFFDIFFFRILLFFDAADALDIVDSWP